MHIYWILWDDGPLACSAHVFIRKNKRVHPADGVGGVSVLPNFALFIWRRFEHTHKLNDAIPVR